MCALWSVHLLNSTEKKVKFFREQKNQQKSFFWNDRLGTPPPLLQKNNMVRVVVALDETTRCVIKILGLETNLLFNHCSQKPTMDGDYY